MKWTLLLCSIALLYCHQYSHAQQIQKIPQKYIRPADRVSLEPSDKRSSKGWVVYSDRSNNQAYTTAGGSTVAHTLSFLEQFYVIEEQGDYVHIAKGHTGNINEDINVYTGNLVKGRDYGWIAKDKLLLWRHCLVNKAKIHQKAMLLNTVEGLRKSSVNANDIEIVDFYNSPELVTKTNKTSKLFQVFYVYKKTKDAVLLCTNSKLTDLDPAIVPDKIFGWVPTKKVNFWDHRIAIEPNWEFNAANERRQKQIKSSILSNPKYAAVYKKGVNVSQDHVFWNSDEYEERKIGDWRRFPVIGNIVREQDTLLKIGVMGEIYNGQNAIQAEKYAKVQRQYNKSRNKLRNVNFIFVVDGTDGMKPYHEAVANGIMNGMDKKVATKNQLRFGAIVYRDGNEKSKLTQVSKISDSPKKVASFLKNIDTRFNDDDDAEAVYYGLETAVKALNLSSDNTNIIILVGDAGNHDREDNSYVDEDKLAERLAKSNCHIFAYQTYSKDDEAYENFIDQIQYLIEEAAIQRFEKYNKLKNQEIGTVETPRFEADGENKYSLKKSALMGGLVFPNLDEKIDPLKLEAEISDNISSIDLRTEKFLSVLDRLVMGSGSSENRFVDEYTQATMNFLETQAGFSQGEINMLSMNNRQFYMYGFTAHQLEGMQHPLFQQVLLLTREELGRVLQTFEELDAATSSSQRREEMQNAWLAIVQRYVGGKPEDLKEMSMDEINEIVFGLPGKSSLLKGVKLKRITDQSAIGDFLFEKYVNDIQQKGAKLKNIFNAINYKFSFKSFDEVYYWVPETFIP